MESGLPDTQKVRKWYHFRYVTMILGPQMNTMFLLWIRVERWKKRKPKRSLVLPFRDERDLLQKYLELYEMINPSIVTGWNIDYFDTPYLYNRIKRLLGEKMSK